MGSFLDTQPSRRRERAGSRAVVPLDMGHVLTRVIRRWPTVLITTALVLALVLAVSALAPRTYRATASVSVGPALPITGTSGGSDVDMPTEVAVAGSRVVAEQAARNLSGGDDVDLARQLLENTEVSSPSQSMVLRIATEANSGREASDRANALAEAYLDDRADSAKVRAQQAADSLKDSLGTMSEDDPSRATLQEALARIQASSHWPGRVISSAVPPPAAAGPGMPTAALAGLVGGLMLAALAALVRDRRAASVGFPDRLEERCGISTVDARGVSAEHVAARVVVALDERYGTSSSGVLAVGAPEGLPDQDLVAELQRQLEAWTVTGTDLAGSLARQRAAASSYDAVVLLVAAHGDLARAVTTVGSLDRGRAGVVPVLCSGPAGARS